MKARVRKFNLELTAEFGTQALQKETSWKFHEGLTLCFTLRMKTQNIIILHKFFILLKCISFFYTRSDCTNPFSARFSATALCISEFPLCTGSAIVVTLEKRHSKKIICSKQTPKELHSINTRNRILQLSLQLFPTVDCCQQRKILEVTEMLC